MYFEKENDVFHLLTLVQQLYKTAKGEKEGKRTLSSGRLTDSEVK